MQYSLTRARRGLSERKTRACRSHTGQPSRGTNAESPFPSWRACVAVQKRRRLATRTRLRRQKGFGWMNLPKRNVDDIRVLARWLATRESIIQIGIGGSALGNLMVHSALLPPYWNELPKGKRNAPRFFMADNIDPVENRAIWGFDRSREHRRHCRQQIRQHRRDRRELPFSGKSCATPWATRQERVIVVTIGKRHSAALCRGDRL